MNKYESTNLHRAVIIAALLGALLAFLPAATASETSCVEHLRCEYRTAPLGIDIAEPRLSWVVRADQRGWQQTAYQVLVASSREKLNQDVGDLWDSGRTVSDQSIQVAYDGRPLKSSMRCWWKVRVWDHRGQLSQWSKPATWTMGLFEKSAWDSAQWIGAREEATMATVTRGWRTPQTDQSAARPWVQIDLGRAAPIEQVRLWNPYDFDKDRFSNRPYVTMCEHVRVDASNTPDMSDSTTLPFIGEPHQRIRQSNYRFDGRGVNARYVRVTVERLPRHADGMWFGLRELEVTSERVNIALGCPATASESVEQDGWSTAYLTDGQQSTDDPSVMLRKSLELTAEPVRATATISGLGYSELYINGDKIGDRVLDPGWCDFTRRVPYTTYDVTRHFKTGENVLGIQLGNGFFNPQVADVWALERAAWVAAPRCRLHVSLDYADGSSRTITSDESWKWSTGELVFNCVRGGETIDKRKAQPQWNKTGFDDESWNPATRLKAPSGRMVAQMYRPVRVMAKPKPQNIREVRPGVWVFDFGQNITGWTRLKTSGPAGHRIVMLFGETVDDDGSVNTLHCTQFIQGRYQKGELILSGNGEEVYEPRFSYFGFRYVQVEGLLEAPNDDTLEGRWVHSDMPETGHFLCSDDRLNCLQEVIVRSNKNYTHHFPRDPAREKLGWTQDAQTCMAMGLMNMEMANIYRNWYTHILDQQQPNGHVRPIGPSSGWGQSYGADATPGICSDPWWGGMVTLMPWIWYEHTGDQRLIEAGYDAMKGWVDYVQGTSTDDMVSWFLGDWCEVSDHHGLARRTPVEQTATAGFFMAVENTRRAAELLGRDEDAKHYAELAGRIRTKFNRKFLDSNTGLYAADSQTSQALPLDLGLSPTATRPLVLERLVEDIHARDDHLSTGFVGTLPLLRVLTDNGRANLAHTIVTREDWPGWLHMLNQGSTTIWEDWSGPKHPGDNVSRNIVSLGGPVGWWFYYGLAGIRPDPAEPGFKKIIIKPEVVADLRWVKAHHDSMYGRIAVHWQRDEERLTLDVTIPANASATVCVPASGPTAVTESGHSALESPGVTFLRTENGCTVFAVGSGSYRFAAPRRSP